MDGPQPPLSDAQIAAYARDAGFWGDSLVNIVAIVLGESGGDPDEYGDEGIQTAVWGPSVGLSQVRSLKAERGKGGTRDELRLDEPAFNLASAWTISAGGTNFRPWSVWTSGDYKEFLGRARAAVAGLGGKSSPSSPGAGGGLQGIANPAGELVGRLVEPLTEGLARIALVGLLVAGGVALVGAGAWSSTSSVRRRGRELVDELAPAGAAP